MSWVNLRFRFGHNKHFREWEKEKEALDNVNGVHKLVGIKLTQKRLDNPTGGSGAENLVREAVLDADGRPVGARIRFWVPVQ